MKWIYSEMSHWAKTKGGPEKALNEIYQRGKLSAIPVIIVFSLAAYSMGRRSKK